MGVHRAWHQGPVFHGPGVLLAPLPTTGLYYPACGCWFGAHADGDASPKSCPVCGEPWRKCLPLRSTAKKR